MPDLTPTAEHWGGSIGVYNIARTNKKTGEKVIVEANIHYGDVAERHATVLWREQGGDLNFYFDVELVGYYPADPVKAKTGPKFTPLQVERKER